MIVLALDTAGVNCAAAVYDSDTDTVLAEVVETIGKGHAERLMAVVDAALAASGATLQQVGRIAVTIGPGSFTGIRVGVSAARGFALSLGIEAVGVSTLETLAARHRLQRDGRNVVVAMDAKRGEVYAQVFSPDGRPLTDPAELRIDAAADLVRAFGATVTGSGAPLLSGEAVGEGPDDFPVALVARLGAKRPAGAEKPRPLYLRAPDAKPQAGFAVSRV